MCLKLLSDKPERVVPENADNDPESVDPDAEEDLKFYNMLWGGDLFGGYAKYWPSAAEAYVAAVENESCDSSTLSTPSRLKRSESGLQGDAETKKGGRV